MEKKPGEILFLVAVLAALAGLSFIFAPPGLYSNEESILYVQMENFILTGSSEIAWPGFQLGFRALDLAEQGGYFQSRDGRVYGATPQLFPWVASLFYPLFRENTVEITPVLFVFLSALIVGLILNRVMKQDFLYYLLLAAFLMGSPVFLQVLLFSGTALALLLIVSALLLLVSHFGDHPSVVKIFGSSFLMGATALIRPECLIVALSFYLCATIILFVQSRMKELWAVTAGGVFGLAVLVLHDVFFHGHFPSAYMKIYLPFYSLSPIRIAVLGGSLTLSFVLIVLSLREGIGPIRKAILSILSVILVFSSVLLTAAKISVSHLMAFFPAVLFVFYGVPERIERLKKGERTLEGILAASVIVCIALGAAILHPGSWIVFSAWLPMVPFVILLIALERKVIFAARGMYIVLTFFCVIAFVNGIQESKNSILKYKNYNAARIAFLEKHTSAGDAILFTDAGSMEHAGPLFFDRIFLLAGSPGNQERLVRQLHEQGIDGIYAWTVNPPGIKTFNPYGEGPLAFPFPPGSKSCCSGSCRERNFYLIRLDTPTVLSTGVGRGGS